MIKLRNLLAASLLLFAAPALAQVQPGTSPLSVAKGGTGGAAVTPQGRLTLTSATPVMATSVSAATRLYYTPYVGNLVPLYNGTIFTWLTFSEVFQDTTDATKSPAAVATSSCYDTFAWLDGTTFRNTRGPAWSSATSRGASAAIAFVNGIGLNNLAITNGPAAQRGTWTGTFCTEAAANINYTFGGAAAGWLGAHFNLWNAYNRVPVSTFIGDSNSSWTYAVASTWRQVNGLAAAVVTVVRGADQDGITLEYKAHGLAGAATTAACGIGLDTFTAFVGSPHIINDSSIARPCTAKYTGLTNGIGYHSFAPIEFNSTTTATTWFGAAGLAYFQTGLNAQLWQ